SRVKRRTATCQSRRPPPDTSRTVGGTGGRALARAGRNEVGRRSTECHRVRFRRPQQHNGGGDEKASSVPNYGVPQRSRFRLPDVDRRPYADQSPIYLTLVIKGCSFLERFEQRTRNVLQRGAFYNVQEGLRPANSYENGSELI